MFDSPPDFFSLVIAIAALIFARKAYVDASRLRARLDAMEAQAGAGAGATTSAPIPPPLPTGETVETAPRVQPAAAEWTPVAVTPVPVEAHAAVAPEADTPAPPLPLAEPGFEERIGTRWVVWIGGLALALGYPAHLGPWLYPLFYVALLVPRQFDDDRRCAAKYGVLWKDYVARVRYRIVPGIY